MKLVKKSLRWLSNFDGERKKWIEWPIDREEVGTEDVYNVYGLCVVFASIYCNAQ